MIFAVAVIAPAAQAQEPAVAPDRTFTIGSTDPNTGYLFAVELTGRGAAINTVKLSRYFSTVKDKQLFEKNPTDHALYAQALRENPAKYKGHYSLMNPVSHGGRTRLPLATRSITAIVDGKEMTWSLDRRTWSRVDYVPAAPSSTDVEGVSFAKTLGAGTQKILRIVKTYEVRKDDYSIRLRVRIRNLSGKPLRVGLDQCGPTGLPREEFTRGGDERQAAYGYLRGEDGLVGYWLKPNKQLNDVPPGGRINLDHSPADPVLWIGEINKFFGAMMYLVPKDPGRLDAASYQSKYYVSAADESAGSKTWLTGVVFPTLQLPAGGQTEIAFDLFAGPKKRDMFTDASAEYSKELYLKLRYIGTIDFGSCFCAWDWLILGLMWLLQTAQTYLTFGNYGLAIILLVVLVRLALHPLTKRSQISMSKMQKLGPAMNELKKKYADDKETLQKEMMKFYKTQGATPILGCLPMLLQMPIWLALWTGLNAAVELRHAAFLPFWITDLAAPDRLIEWTDPLPLIGTSFNLLPILLTVAMYLQTRLNPQMASAAASPDQAKQQKMMQYMMPGMMMVFFYNAPAGLTMYIMASTFAGVAEQYAIRRHIRQKEELAAAMETTVVAPGKGARSSRPRKPKGPSWVKRG